MKNWRVVSQTGHAVYIASTQTVSINVYLSIYERSSTAKLHAEVWKHSVALIYSIYSDFNNDLRGTEWAQGLSSEANDATEDRQAVAVLDQI